MSSNVKNKPAKAPKVPKAPKAPVSQGIPLGVHIFTDGVAVVDMSNRGGSPSVRAHSAIDVKTVVGTSPQDQQVEALKACLDQIGAKTRECVLSVLPTQALNKRFEIPPKASKKNIQTAAELEADEMTNNTWAAEERVLSLDPLPGTTDHLISIARRDNVDAIVDVAKKAGLTPVAVDTPLTAWQRSVRNETTDALLEFTYLRPVLYVFGDPIGEMILFPAAMDVETLAEQVLNELVTFRSKRRIEVRNLRVVGNYDEIEELTSLLKRDAGLNIQPLTFGENENPPWSYAVALATWSFANAGKTSK